MLIISVEIMKIVDEREMQKKQQKKNKQKQKVARGTEAIVKGWEKTFSFTKILFRPNSYKTEV